MRAVLIGLVVVVLALVGLFVFGRDLLPGGAPAEPIEVSPAAAASAEAKLERLATEGEEARLNDVEVTSLLRYRAEALPASVVRDPSVSFAGDTLIVTGAVPTDAIPNQPELEAVRYLLPDTADVRVAGVLSSGPTGATILRVVSVEVAGMPVPERFYPLILDRFGRSGAEPDGAIELSLPGNVSSARVEDGALVLTP